MVLALKNIGRGSPWPALSDWTRDFDPLFTQMDRMMSPVRTSAQDSGLAFMACDLHESESGYLLSIDLPGIKKSDISIESTGNNLAISASRPRETTTNETNSLQSEHMFGEVKRSFAIPEGIDSSKIQANLDEGVLHLSLPKVEARKPKKIEIGSGKTGFLHKLMGHEEKCEKQG